jgi:uncharacterized membrane protein YgcG
VPPSVTVPAARNAAGPSAEAGTVPDPGGDPGPGTGSGHHPDQARGVSTTATAVTAPTSATTQAARATTAASAQPSSALPAEGGVADQITRHLLISRTLRDGTRSTVLNLRPEHLGSVRITVEVQSGQVRLGMAAGQAALSVLRTDLPHLRAQLGQEGLTLTDVQTHTQDADASPQDGSSRSDTTGGTDPGGGGGSGRADSGNSSGIGSRVTTAPGPGPVPGDAGTTPGLDIKV